MPFTCAALATTFKGFELTNDEKKMVSGLGDQVAMQYAPTLGPHGALIALSMAIMALAGTKFVAYSDWKREQKKEREDKYPRGVTRSETGTAATV